VKYILYLFIIISFSFSRDNPFEDTKLPKSIFSDQGVNSLREKAFYLPDEAREIKEIIIKYKRMDGSRAAKIIDVNKKIDWRIPIILTQRKTDKREEKKKINYIEFTPFKFIKYKVSDDEVFILTSSLNMRHFMLPNPYKIIMDFSYDSYFETHKININKSLKVKSITTGSHDGFFRVALELVGKYNYKVEKVRNGYKVTFK
jgi:hypothetical protein